MKYKVGDKVKIVDANRREDAICGFETGDIVTIIDCYDDKQRYMIIKDDFTGYIDECNLKDLNSYTWEDFEKCPIGTKVTFESGEEYVKTSNEEECFDGDYFYRNYEDLEDFKDNSDTHNLGKIIKIEEPTYTTVYEPTEEVKEMTIAELEKELGYKIKVVKEKSK